MSPPDDLKRLTGRGISERIKGFEQLCKTISGPLKNGESVKENSIVQEHDREGVAKIVGADKEGSFKFTLGGRSIESSEPTKLLQDTVSTSKGLTIGVEEANSKDTQSKEAEGSLAEKLSQIDRQISRSKDPSNEDVQDLDHQNVPKQEFLPVQPKKGVLWKIRDVVQTFEKMRDVKLSKKAVLVQSEDRQRIDNSSTLERSDKDNPLLQVDIEAGFAESKYKGRTSNNSGGFEKCKERFGKELPNVSTPENTSRNANQKTDLLERPQEERHKNDRAIEWAVRTNNTSKFEESLGEDRFHKKLLDTSTTTDQKPCRNNVQGELKEERHQSRTREGTKFKDAVQKFQIMSEPNRTPVIKEERVEDTSCKSNCTSPIKEESLNDPGNKSCSGGKSEVCLPKVCKMGDDVETGKIGEETIVSSAVQNFESMSELNYRISVEKLRDGDTGHCPGSSPWKIRDKVANFEKLAKVMVEENIPKSQNNKKITSTNKNGTSMREAVQTCNEDPDSKDALNISNKERMEIDTNEENVPHDSQGLSFKDEDAPVQNEENIGKSFKVEAGTNEENRLEKSDSQGLLCKDEDTFDQSEKSANKSFTDLTNAPGPIFNEFEDVIVHSDLVSSSSESCPDTVLKISENFEKLARANLVHETNEAIGEIAQVHDEESLPEPDKELLTKSFVQSEETSGSTCQLSRLGREESQYGSEKCLYVQSEETQQSNGHEKSSQLDRKQSCSGSDQDLMYVQNEETPVEKLSRLHREESQSKSDKELFVRNEQLQKSNCHENLAQVNREERQVGSNQDLITKLFVQNEETPKEKLSQHDRQESQPGSDKSLYDQNEETRRRTCCFNENLTIERASIQNEETCLGKCQDHNSDQRFSVDEDFLLGHNEETRHGKCQEQFPGQNNEERQSGPSVKTDFLSELGYVRNEETPKSSKASPNGQSRTSGQNEENLESNTHYGEDPERSPKESSEGHPLSKASVKNEENPESDAQNEETSERSSKASPKDQYLSETDVENPKSDENIEETLKRLSEASPKGQTLSAASAKNEESPKSDAQNKGTSKISSKVSTNGQSFSEAGVENLERVAQEEENPKGSSKAPPKGQLSSEASVTNEENLVSGTQNEKTSEIIVEIEETPESIVQYEEIQESNVHNAESTCKEHLSRRKLEESQAKTYIQNEETQGTIWMPWMNCEETGSAEASEKVFLSGANVQSEEICVDQFREQLLVQKEERYCEETLTNVLPGDQPLSEVKEISETTCQKQLLPERQNKKIPKSLEKLPQLDFEETKTQPGEAAVNEETLRSAPLTKASVNTVYVENEDSQTGSDESVFTEETVLHNREENHYEPAKLSRLGYKEVQNKESALFEENCEERRNYAIAVEEESHNGIMCTGKEDEEGQAKDNEEGSSYASEDSFEHFSTSELVDNSEARSTEDYMDACETGLSVEDVCTNEETLFVRVGIREAIKNFEAMSQRGCEDRTKKFKVSGSYGSRIEEWESSPKPRCRTSVKKICKETYLKPGEESWHSPRVVEGENNCEEECFRLGEETWCPSKFVKLQGNKTPVKKNCNETYLAKGASPAFLELQEGESSAKKAFREDLASESEEETRKDFLSDVRRLIDGFERTVYFNRDVKKKLLVEKYREEAKEALNHYVEAITTEWPSEFLLEDEDWVCSRCSEKEKVTWLGFFIDGRILDVIGYVLLLCFVMFLVNSSRSVFMQFGDFHK